MTNRKTFTTPLVCCSVLSLAALTIGLSGCGGEDPVARAPSPRSAPRAPSAAPAASRLVPVQELMSQLGIDARIRLGEAQAPNSTAARKAVLEFFDAFARGDHQAAGEMMFMDEKYALESLVESGDWDTTTAQITEVLLETGTSPLGLECAYAVFEIGETYQPQLWYYSDEGEGFIFEAAPAPPNIMNRLYGLDPIEIWHKILEEEQELANKPDEDIEVAQVVVDENSSRNGGPGRPQGDGPGSMAPGVDNPVSSPGRGIPGPTPGGG